MLTQVKTPQDIFFLPQRLLVPLFQRPYVWTLESQWEPLWGDVVRLAERMLKGEPQVRHFLGAVVIQQQQTSIGTLSARSIIDGQQRLTTLQLLLDAIHDSVAKRDLPDLAHQLQDLIRNQEHHCKEPAERFKVWPTNRDRDAFEEVMSGSVEDYQQLKHKRSRMSQAHSYFRSACDEWLDSSQHDARKAADCLVQAVMLGLQIVVIDLQVDEDAQEIFETLNARGTPLSAADLIKNFVFQRLDVTPEDQERIYHEQWEHFETPFWETEVSSGRINYSRSSLFLTQWLISQTRQEITGREVFSAFKRHIIEGNASTLTVLANIKASAAIYEKLTLDAQERHKPLDTASLFMYRINTMQSEVVKPVLIWLLDPSLPRVPPDQFDRAIRALESWLVRRTVVRATKAGYNKLVVDLLQAIGPRPREDVGDYIERYLSQQKTPTLYWPGDEELRRELSEASIYNTLSRARLRMILEAIEDHRRGFDSARPKHEQTVVRSTCTVEHVLPQQWRTHWPVTGVEAERARDAVVHRLGNLTLATQALNSEASNAAWLGAKGKRQAFDKHTSLLITRDVFDRGLNEWEEERIGARTQTMIDDLLAIWPVPEGHTGIVSGARERLSSRVSVTDLLNTGLLTPGQTLYARLKTFRGRTCEVGADGRLYVNGESFFSLSGAAKAVTKSQSEAGWWFWLIQLDGDLCMSDLRRDYLDLIGLDDRDEDEGIEMEE